MLSQRVRTLAPSATIAVNNLRLELERQGREVFNFSVGEPDFATPDFVCRAAADAVERGWTKYTSAAGVPELRQAIARHAGAMRGESIAPDEVIVTCGAKHACAAVLLARVDPGDEVLLPAPFWVSYPEMIRLADGIPVVVPTRRRDGYRVTPDLLEPHMTPRTVGIIVNSPGNPTGAVAARADVDALVRFADAHDLWILSDEIYDQFIYEGTLASPFSGAGRPRTTLVGGVSKTCAMTGWRIGWAIGQRDFVGALTRLQEHTTSNAAAVSQAAALAALAAPDASFLAGMREEFRLRRGRALELLAEVPGLGFAPPAGAFYVFIDLSEVLGRGALPRTAQEFCTRLLEEAGVALVPGEPFGDPSGARLSYACSIDHLTGGIRRLGEWIAAKSRAPAR